MTNQHQINVANILARDPRVQRLARELAELEAKRMDKSTELINAKSAALCAAFYPSSAD